MDIKNNDSLESIQVHNKEGIKEFLKNLTFPVYFLDFEAITNSKDWMFNHGLSIDQQISSFSILKIVDEKDDETKIKHFNNIGEREDYKLMAKSLTDFYKDQDGTVIVWGQDLELRAIAKLIKEAPDGLHKKLGKMLSNIIDLQQLFYGHSFIQMGESHKTSLDVVSKGFGTYLPATLKDGKKAHYVLEHVVTTDGISSSHVDNIKRRIQEYNNSDVINIKRVLIEVLKLIKE